jgi:hypothetical protein
MKSTLIHLWSVLNFEVAVFNRQKSRSCKILFLHSC